MMDVIEFDSERIDYNSCERERITKAMFLAVALHCKKMLYNYLYEQDKVSSVSQDLTIKTALEQLEEMSTKYFGLSKIHFIEYAPFSTMMLETKNAIVDAKKKKPFINGAAFKSVDGCVCRTHWIEVTPEKEIVLYSMHINTESSENKKLDEQLYNLAYQQYVIEGAGYKVAKTIIMYIDNNYRKPKYGQDAKKLFSTMDVTRLVNSIVTGIPVELEDGKMLETLSVSDILKDVREIASYRNAPIDALKALCPKCQTNGGCQTPRDCQCLNACKKDMGAENSIVWKLVGARKDKKHNLANDGYLTASVLLAVNSMGTIKLNEKQVRQLEFEVDKNKAHHIESENIKNWWNKTYGNATKLYFLDYETFQFAIPKWQNLAPYAKVPVQFSLHIWDKSTQTMEHHEFLVRKGEDPRRRCAEMLCELIPMDGIGIAYNAGFEKSVCHDLANTFDDLAEHLNAIADNMTDIMVPFQKHWYYRSEFDGRYSIKFVLPGLFPTDATLDYHNLEEVQNGVMAMDAYLRIMSMDGKEAKRTRKNMLAYCALDTFAMVKIFWYLEKLVETNFDENRTIAAMHQYDAFSAQGKVDNAIISVSPKKSKKVV